MAKYPHTEDISKKELEEIEDAKIQYMYDAKVFCSLISTWENYMVFSMKIYTCIFYAKVKSQNCELL